MIKATLGETKEAYIALRRIGEQIRLGQDAAWKVMGLLRKMKPLMTDFDETQLKLYRDAGGIEQGAGIQIVLAPRMDDETDEAFAVRQTAFTNASNALNDQIRALLKQEVEIERDPLTRALFDDVPNLPEEMKKRFNANDLADLGPFLTE